MEEYQGGMILPPEELVRQIEGYGFTMFVGMDGIVHGKPVAPGKKVPFEMQPLLEQLRLQNEAVAVVLRNREDTAGEVVDLDGITRDDAVYWLTLVRDGDYRLLPGTQVIYNRSTGLTHMKLEKVKK